MCLCNLSNKNRRPGFCTWSTSVCCTTFLEVSVVADFYAKSWWSRVRWMSLYLSRLQRRPCKNSCNTVHRPFMSLTELDAEENQPPRETMPVAVSLPCETSFIISINLIHQRFNTERLSGSELTVLSRLLWWIVFLAYVLFCPADSSLLFVALLWTSSAGIGYHVLPSSLWEISSSRLTK